MADRGQPCFTPDQASRNSPSPPRIFVADALKDWAINSLSMGGIPLFSKTCRRRGIGTELNALRTSRYAMYPCPCVSTHCCALAWRDKVAWLHACPFRPPCCVDDSDLSSVGVITRCTQPMTNLYTTVVNDIGRQAFPCLKSPFLKKATVSFLRRGVGNSPVMRISRTKSPTTLNCSGGRMLTA